MKIEKFSISNYRSLKEFQVEKFDLTTIFYGENNAGKSNILSALHTIFKRKEEYDRGAFTPPASFIQGILPDFTSNFYNQDESEKIRFTVELSAKASEFIFSPPVVDFFTTLGRDFSIVINGEIFSSPTLEGAGQMKTTHIFVNNKSIYDNRNSSVKYFPALLAEDNANIGELSASFTNFIEPLNDCVYAIGNERDMLPVVIHNTEEYFELSPKTFKQFLYDLYLSERDYAIFKEINTIFNSEPFSFGSISFSHINGELEIMVEENNIRLPIKHIGSGVLQVLYIIVAIVCSDNKIVCIEELEQNLSPALQNRALRKIQSMIGTKAHQIILSSHSPVFAKPEYSDTIYLIKKEDGKTVITGKIEKEKELEKSAKIHFAHTAFPGVYKDDDEYKA